MRNIATCQNGIFVVNGGEWPLFFPRDRIIDCTCAQANNLVGFYGLSFLDERPHYSKLVQISISIDDSTTISILYFFLFSYLLFSYFFLINSYENIVI